MKIHFETRRLMVLVAMFNLGCGVDRLQHVTSPADAAIDLADSGMSDAGAVDAGGISDSGVPDAGPHDAGVDEDAGVDAGSTEQDAGPKEPDAGVDAGTSCTVSGISPQLAALTGGPYQNCQGGTIPRTDIQLGTEPWSGCCDELVRVCQVTGYSMMNAIYCR